METIEIFKKARNAVREIKNIPSDKKTTALLYCAIFLEKNTEYILEQNLIDIENAKGVISDVMLDRLQLTEDRIKAMANGIREVAMLADPNGLLVDRIQRPNGLLIEKKLVPMGVIGIIYESRPNVTSDAAALCLKSSNVCILRSGKEAYNTSKAIVDSLRAALVECKINPDWIQLIDDTTRQSSYDMMTAKGYIDLLIPRGGKGLIKACVENATVPCIETGTGICHIYVEKTADIDSAVNIVDNAKTSRPSVCNACEVCIVDSRIAAEFLPKLYKRLTENREHPVKFIADAYARQYIEAEMADENSYDTEFLDYILAIKTVDGVDEAVKHILAHSTGHSESIITQDEVAAKYFVNNTDSAAVYVNASTRFTDGGEFGLGCEMGISTQKIHARGPLGLKELMTYHYVVSGNGQIR